MSMILIGRYVELAAYVTFVSMSASLCLDRLPTFFGHIVKATFIMTLKEKHEVSDAIARRNSMGKKLYVGNLDYGISSSDLQELLSQHGTVESAEVISDRVTGRSKGFGFVEMSSDEEAQAAISALNGQEHNGRTLTVNEAKPRQPRSGGGGGGGGRYGGARSGQRDRY